MKKQLLTPRRAEELQRQIYYNMSDEKKINLVSDFYVLAHTLKNSKTISKHGSERAADKSN